jgi:hypothetical protein
LDGSRELEEAIAEGTLAMIDMCDNAKVSIAFDWDGGDTLLKIG